MKTSNVWHGILVGLFYVLIFSGFGWLLYYVSRPTMPPAVDKFSKRLDLKIEEYGRSGRDIAMIDIETETKELMDLRLCFAESRGWEVSYRYSERDLDPRAPNIYHASLVKTLTESEISQFRRWVHCPPVTPEMIEVNKFYNGLTNTSGAK